MYFDERSVCWFCIKECLSDETYVTVLQLRCRNNAHCYVLYNNYVPTTLSYSDDRTRRILIRSWIFTCKYKKKRCNARSITKVGAPGSRRMLMNLPSDM